MIAVALELYGSLRCAIGTKQLSLNLPDGSSIDDAIDVMLEQSAAGVESLVRRADGSSNVIVRLNGRPAQTDNVDLRSGDVIQQLYPVSGG